jgi:hypothetical protein
MVFLMLPRISLLSIIVASSVTAFPAFNGTSSSFVTYNHSLLVNQKSSELHPDYTCGPDRPCQNGACCGKSNIRGSVYWQCRIGFNVLTSTIALEHCTVARDASRTVTPKLNVVEMLRIMVLSAH